MWRSSACSCLDRLEFGDVVERLALDVLATVIREWVATVYHHAVHEGLALPEVPRLELTPMQAYRMGIARAGGVHLPAEEGLAQEFLEVRWRGSHHYGVNVDGLRYDGAALNPYRGITSPHTGRHSGKWPFHLDVHDVRHLHFRDPDGGWHLIPWEHAPTLDAPFSKDGVEHAKRLAEASGRGLDPTAAVMELLVRWEKGDVVERRERNLARRLAARRDHALTADEHAAAATSAALAVPGVIDMAMARASRRAEVQDELDEYETFDEIDVFEVIE